MLKENQQPDEKSLRKSARKNSVGATSYLIGRKDGVRRPVVLLNSEGPYTYVLIGGHEQKVRTERLGRQSADIDLVFD